MKKGVIPIQGGPRKEPVNLRLGFLTEDVGYSIDLGLPPPDMPRPPEGPSAFAHDPQGLLDAPSWKWPER